MKAKIFHWIWVAVLVVIAGVAQPLRASAAESARAALWTAVDGALRRIEPAGAGHYTAASPANRLTFRFGPNAVEAAPATIDGAWSWSLTLTGYGAPGAVRAVASASVTADDHRIEYRRGALTEWYDNRPEGLEQGFTLAAPLAHGGGDTLVLAMRVAGGLTPRLDPSAQILSFHRPDGKAVLHYGKVTVSDARGRSLPARLTLAGSAIEIHVATRGAAWPVTVDPLVTGTPAEFTVMDPSVGSAGFSVALAGDTALVGAPLSAAGGAAYVFTRSGTNWSQQAKLSLAAPGIIPDLFGSSVALSADGNTALVGALGRNVTGAAYVFTRSGASWSQQAEFAGALGDAAGTSVALSPDGNTALVGLPNRSTGTAKKSGGAVVFTRSGTTWSQQKILLPPKAVEGGYFGRSVALSSNAALIGATGMNDKKGVVYVYTSPGWTLQDTLAISSSAPGDKFGNSVALSGDTALVSSPARAAYVFTRSGSKWNLQQELRDPDVSTLDGFGNCDASCVALSGDIAVVGDPKSTAYVYLRSGTTWSQEQPLRPDDATEDDQFGSSVAMSGDAVLLGAPGGNKGYVYTFTRTPVNGPTPFATFDVTQFFAAAPTRLSLETTFTLGQGSNGISPLTEPLTLTVGGFTTTIPAGGFIKVKGRAGKGSAHEAFLYDGQTGVVFVEAQIIPMGHGKSGESYLFQIWEWGGGIAVSNETFLPVELTIGDDRGTTEVIR